MTSMWFRALLPFLLVSSVLAVENNFDFYPKNARPCLYESSKDAGCDKQGTVQKLNTCLCGNNGDFIINAAKCIGEKDPDDGAEVYKTMSTACDDSNTPMSVEKKDYDAALDEGKNPTTTTSAATSGATTTETGDATQTGEGDDEDSGGLSSGATIGVAVGAAAAGGAFIGALAFWLIRRRKKRGEESHPMLPTTHASPYSDPATFDASQPAPPYGQYTDEQKAAWAAAGHSPHPAASPHPTDPRQASPMTTSWGGSPPAAYAGPYAPPAHVAELPPENNVIYEMDGTGTAQPAVEMPGSEPTQSPQPPR